MAGLLAWAANTPLPIRSRAFAEYDYNDFGTRTANWPAPGSEDTELGVLMELEVGHGETEVHAGVFKINRTIRPLGLLIAQSEKEPIEPLFNPLHAVWDLFKRRVRRPFDAALANGR